jgi:hypothetical protein
MVKKFLILRLAILLACCAISWSSAFAQGGKPVFEPRYVPEATVTPVRRLEPTEPIPRGWFIGGAIVALLAVGGLLYAATKAWRSSTLFGRKYYFPPAGSAALRFGGNRSGGFMAAIEPTKNKDT